MIAMVFVLLASAVLVILFWSTAAVIAVAILRGLIWLITRPIVWLVIMPLQYLLGGSRTPAPATQQVPVRASNSQKMPSAEKLQQLSKLKALHDCGAITQAEFDRLKRELLST